MKAGRLDVLIQCENRRGPVRWRSRWKDIHGFTLIEIACVLIILGILSAVVFSRMATSSTHELLSQVEAIKGHIRYAQTRAMDSNAAWGISFTTSSYTLFNSISGSNPLLPGIGSNTSTLPSGMTASADLVSFDSWGRPCTDTVARTLQNEGAGLKIITISHRGNSETIRIHNNTGYVP